jgi:hypothetical protein
MVLFFRQTPGPKPAIASIKPRAATRIVVVGSGGSPFTEGTCADEGGLGDTLGNSVGYGETGKVVE